MRRRLRNLLTALSLLLCMAAVALWVRSFWIADCLSCAWLKPRDERDRVDDLQVLSNKGGLSVVATFTPRGKGSPTEPHFTWGASYAEWIASGDTFLGFDFETFVSPKLDGDFRQWEVVVPWWFVTLSLAALPGLRLYRRVRPRYAAGRCQVCGYDLRATPGRCPECGTEAGPVG